MSIYRQRPSYTTRPSLGQRLLKLLLLLLILGGLASALFLFFFRGYVVNTPSGPRLQIPFFLKTQSQAKGEDKAEAKTSAVFGDDTSVTVPDSPKRAELLTPLHAITLSEDSILNGTVEEDMKKAGANAVIFNMRADDGSLHYISQLKTAIDSQESDASPGRNAAIQTMNRNPALYTIARVSCFRDAYVSKVCPDLCLQRDSGVPWRDNDNMTWLSPSKNSVQKYLQDICQELASLGFDEILLTNCGYPTQGARAQQFDGSENVATLSLTLNDFYQETRRVLQQEGVSLSLLWEDAKKNDKQKPLSGQNLEDMLPLADRVFLAGDEAQVAEVFSSRGLSCTLQSFVPILSKPGQSSNSWAVFSTLPKNPTQSP